MESILHVPTHKTVIKVSKQTRYNFSDCLEIEYNAKVSICFKEPVMKIQRSKKDLSLFVLNVC